MRLFFVKKYFISINTNVKRFEKLFRENYLKYHYSPFADNSLDPRVFSFFEDEREPELMQGARTHILRDIQYLNDIEAQGTNTRILDYVIIDSVLLPNAKHDCPVDILVQLNTANLHDVLKERLINATVKLNNRKLTNSLHPMNYQLSENKIVLDNYERAYHPYYNKWVKLPRHLGS